MKQFETREELLQDAINYYWGKPERRCVDELGNCIYPPTDTSEGCAIGRLLPLDLAERLGLDGVEDDIIFCSLPEWLQNMGKRFLVNLQCCHDFSTFSSMHMDGVYYSMQSHVDMTKIVFPNN
jgi:hypothetical protein